MSARLRLVPSSVGSNGQMTAVVTRVPPERGYDAEWISNAARGALSNKERRALVLANPAETFLVANQRCILQTLARSTIPPHTTLLKFISCFGVEKSFQAGRVHSQAVEVEASLLGEISAE